jgi:hypothetical protein
MPLDLDSFMGDLSREDRRYLESRSWCRRVYDVYLAVDDLAVVFLVQFDPLTEEADSEAWVISGNVPLSYLDTKCCETPFDALTAYCVLMFVWIQSTLGKKSMENCIELRSHETFQLLTSASDARECIPNMTALAERLVSDKHSFELLDKDNQSGLLNVEKAGRKWLAKYKSTVAMADRNGIR